ncbi:ABC transporter permease [Ferrimonas balearica]|uniref:ABC transporter permease n=1 Tax=Ferrimonas balearica TaxID=44012 RepID=UPI001C99D44A|nr:FtsX-like permease family protein [Ferrimonas balearica]MBY5920762.1 ABC transporter permease [Ferrimonas balearica]MBY5996553.1 ABC transporter permease [Ferrimonas balearica]
MLVKLAWRNLWRNKLRTAIMLGAMTFGLLGVIVMIGFINGLYGNMIQNAIAWQTSHLQVHNSRYLTHPDIQDTLQDADALTRWLETQPTVTGWSSRLIAEGMVASARSTRGIRINGVVPEREAGVTPVADHIRQGAWLDEQGRNPVVLSSKTAERLRLKVGSKVVLTFTDPEGEVTGAAFRVRGLYQSPISAFDDANLYVRQPDLAKLAHLQGVHEIAIVTDDGGELPHPETEAVKEALTRIAGSESQVRDWQTVQPMLAAIIGQMGISNAIILGIYVLAMSFGIVNVMLMSVFERTREFGVLMAVGMTKPRILILILLEATLLGVCGGVLGLLASLALMSWLADTGIPLGSMAEGLAAFGADTQLYPLVHPADYLMVLVTVLVASLLSALYPARQILKQRPVDAMAQ